MSHATYDMLAAYIEAQLTLLPLQLETAYPGYPGRHERLVLDAHELGALALDTVALPDGPWETVSRQAAEPRAPLPTELERYWFLQQGYRLDTAGRPLHPWTDHMISDPAIGVVTGKGAYWNWGPNHTADSVIVHDDHLLLIKRGDTGTWALPGGFLDKNEDALHAARREAFEETGLDLEHAWANRLYRGPVVDPRMTANAWPETSAYLFRLDAAQPRPEPKAGDDAVGYEWIPLADLETRKLFGSHRFLAALALSQMQAVTCTMS